MNRTPVAYEDEWITLYVGDCTQIWSSKSIGQRVDAVITDPPYGETSLAWDRWPNNWTRHAADHTDSMWCFGSMRMFLERGDEFTRHGWQLSQDIVWEKHNGSGFHNDRFRRVHEHALHWYRGQWRDIHHEAQVTLDARAKQVRRKERPAHMGEIEGTTYISEDGGPRLRTSVLKVPSMHGKAIHPTEKPEGILDPLIRYAVPEDGILLDPFAGSGSTLAAARLAGRRAIGIEANPVYAEAAAARLAQGVLIG